MNNDSIHILIVEDHVALAENLFEYFSTPQYTLDFAADGLTALHLLATNRYDVIILDVMLPGVSGYEICRRIRDDLKCTTPVILTTAKDQIQDKEQGFRQGADDYLVKPFNLRELELRIQALHRRSHSAILQNSQLKVGNILFNPQTLEVTIPNYPPLTLGSSGARLFETFMRNHPAIVSYEQLQDCINRSKEIDTHALRTHVYLLRKQLQQHFNDPMIRTVHGRGYRLQPETHT
ncbi:Two-component response regulator [gamma proteobacterium HdN1]|nr:Two-component response regulator [gamma proteobacterium HdN1]